MEGELVGEYEWYKISCQPTLKRNHAGSKQGWDSEGMGKNGVVTKITTIFFTKLNMEKDKCYLLVTNTQEKSCIIFSGNIVILMKW